MMLIDIKEEDKIRIGYFIDVERRNSLKKKGKQFVIENFIQDICSRQTYNKIVKGLPLKESEIYDSLLERLDVHYDYVDDLKRQIIPLEQAMIKALNDKNLTVFYQRLKDGILLLSQYQIFALENVTLQCFLILLKTEKTMKFIKKDYQFLVKHFPILNDLEKELCAYFILSYIYNHDISDENLKFMMQQINFLNIKESFNKMFTLDLLIRLQRFYDASIYCDKLLVELKEAKRSSSYQECLISRLFLISQIQPSSFDEYKTEYLEMYKANQNKELPICNFYHIVGLHYYRNKEMEKAYDCFLKVVNHKRFFFPAIILLNHIASLLHYELPSELKEEKNVENYEEEWQIIYHYYCLKHRGVDVKEREEYLWKFARKLVKKTYPSWMMKNIIATELNEIADKTGDRRRLYQFNKMIV